MKARERGQNVTVNSTEFVRERVRIIVTRAFDRYGYFPVEKDQRRFFDVAVNTVLKVTDRIEKSQVPGVEQIKEEILGSVYIFGLDNSISLEVFRYVFEEIEEEFTREQLVNEIIIRQYYQYSDLIEKALQDYSKLFDTDIIQFLNGLEQYGISDRIRERRVTRSRLFIENRSGEGYSDSRAKGKYSDFFDSRVKEFSRVISDASVDINSIVSDSKVTDFTIPADLDPELLTATFAGAGKQLFDDISRLFNISAEFGGYQGSFVNAVEYQSVYYEYLMALCYGRKIPLGLLGESFGNFESSFQERPLRESEIPGLKFLEPVVRFGDGVNPVAEKFAMGGLSDRYVSRIPGTLPVDFVALTLEAIYSRCLKIGDATRAVINSKPEKIGHTLLHMQILNKVFPSSSDFVGRNSGLTGGIFTLLRGHTSLSKVLGGNVLAQYNVVNHLRLLKQSVESLAGDFKSVGFKPGGFVPSLELLYHEPRKSEVKKSLLGLGFEGSEAERIVSVSSFSELLEVLAPLTSSDDVISFFRAFDLTKLIYEFGGEEAIKQYVDFLYGKDEQGSIVRLLGFLDVNRTQRSVTAASGYSKLIGYLVSLTYAINPEQLQIFDSFLKRNNLNLLESISTLIEAGQDTVIKSSGDISLLSGMVAQMVVSDNSGYEGQKPIWNKLIEESAGNVGKSVKGLYLDREGITPTELYFLLNNPSATSPLGEMLNGVRGGRLTSILRYCNIFGLLYSLSDFRNSYQSINQQAEDFTTLLDLVSSLDELSQFLEVGIRVLQDYESDDPSTSVYSDPVVKAQNKEFSALIEVVKGSPGAVDGKKIAESPGTGNSRLPGRVKIDNSLTPEEASLILDSGRDLGVFTESPTSEEGSYVRLSLSNLLANGVIVDPEVSKDLGDSTVTESTPLSDTVTLYRPAERVPGILQPREFDRLRSCEKFGGKNCGQLGYEDNPTCSKGFSKALSPENGYGTTPISPGVEIDRALGESLAARPEPVKIPRGNGNYFFSQSGLTELSRSPVFKDSEMLCASLKDPFEYGACISMLKCKKFDPPYRGKYFFNFCPRSLFGGRLAP